MEIIPGFDNQTRHTQLTSPVYLLSENPENSYFQLIYPKSRNKTYEFEYFISQIPTLAC